MKLSQVMALITDSAVRLVDEKDQTIAYIVRGMTLRSVAPEYADRLVYSINAEMCGVVEIKI